jgi:hypothetical protein
MPESMTDDQYNAYTIADRVRLGGFPDIRKSAKIVRLAGQFFCALDGRW